MPEPDIDTRRRRARFRSWHRGTREADLVLGPFADEAIGTLTETELAQYEALLEAPDVEILKWITGEAPVPAAFDTALLTKIIARFRATN